MGQKKLIRFEAIKSFPNVLQYPEGMPGKWAAFFKNENPLTLELACGKGEYTVSLARMHPDRNFIGIDLKGNRIYIGAKKCLEDKIGNAAFLRSHIDKILNYFAPGEVKEIWLTFPDPQLRLSRIRKRLTHPEFLRLYGQILVPGGRIRLKTDSPALYSFTKSVIGLYGLELLEDSQDVQTAIDTPASAGLENLPEEVIRELAIKTHYQGLDIAKSNRIYYCCFSLPANALPPIDDILHERCKQLELQTT
ncbi:MAG: tRNA (guanosine(46)-N7)-methyltransferase TrmB [Puia sp.]|nr:tRNA (guanosine(46)-N7)-methyltransferase TrmB [Puia sp.]